MEAIGINVWYLLVQLTLLVLFFGLPLITLIGLAKKKMSGAPLAIWTLVICAVPLLGALAYWIIKPTAENQS